MFSYRKINSSSVFVCIHVYIRVDAFVCRAQLCVCACVEGNSHLWASFLSDHFVFWDSWGLALPSGLGWLVKEPKGFLSLANNSALEFQVHATMDKHHYKCFSHGFGEFNSDPHVYIPSTLWTDLSFQPLLQFYKKKDEGMPHINTSTSLFPSIYGLYRFSQWWLKK